MKSIKKRISAVLLSVYMVFGVVSTDYLTVNAFEWVVPSLTVGDSILWLMGLLGITYTEGASAWRDVSPEYEKDFINYANEHGLTYTETNSWLNETAQGKLNQLSNVWSNFKEWVSSLFGNDIPSVGESASLSSFVSLLPITSTYTIDSSIQADTISSDSFFFARLNNGVLNELYIYTNVSDITIATSSVGALFSCEATRGVSLGYIYNANNHVISKYNNISGTQSHTLTNNSSYTYYISPFDSSFFLNHSFKFSCNTWFSSDSAVHKDLDVYNSAIIPDINFADADTENPSIPGVIDLPWGNLGDDEEERDKTYDDLVGGLDLGQEIGDLWQALQDLMGVLAVDDTGVLQPNDGGENPPTLDDEIENNKINGAFVLTGLQRVFPFCIPFDLYAFITLLEAPPVAPVIQYPIYNPVTDSNEIITIDFSTWESVVVLFRYIFDFLFIVGLLLIARALIGGGDSA